MSSTPEALLASTRAVHPPDPCCHQRISPAPVTAATTSRSPSASMSPTSTSVTPVADEAMSSMVQAEPSPLSLDHQRTLSPSRMPPTTSREPSPLTSPRARPMAPSANPAIVCVVQPEPVFSNHRISSSTSEATTRSMSPSASMSPAATRRAPSDGATDDGADQSISRAGRSRPTTSNDIRTTRALDTIETSTSGSSARRKTEHRAGSSHARVVQRRNRT
jgi:hypothetical protein